LGPYLGVFPLKQTSHGVAKSEHPRLTKGEINFEEFQPMGTLKTRDWKTRDHEIYGGGKRETKFAGVEKAGQACMEREMTKNRKFSLIDNPVV